MVKQKNTKKSELSKKSNKRPKILTLSLLLLSGLFLLIFFFLSFFYHFEKTYTDKIYPGVKIDQISFGGKKREDVEKYFSEKSMPFKSLSFILRYEDKIATLSAEELDVSFDGKLSSVQSFSIGRSSHFFSNLYQKWLASTVGINLSSIIRMNNDYINEAFDRLSKDIFVEPENALFRFENGKVSVFKLSKSGKRLNVQKSKELIYSSINETAKSGKTPDLSVVIDLPIETVLPSVTTENSNNFGIKELVGVGVSKFTGSIAGRVHNIELAASRISGHLVAPDNIFSFNKTLGDVSAATGYQQAYIIKDGRTVLGDGGGVCQVSTTLFRAALSSGLPITERNAHSYRVSYYEQDSSPGIDATVFDPNYDLKFKNDTGNFILIQSSVDRANYKLTFEIFGTSDKRKVEMTKPVILSQVPPPPDLYQDDPTLPKGTVKQVDWKAWGAKVSFDYRVTRDNEIIFQKSFFSNYQPWQAVFLRGTKE